MNGRVSRALRRAARKLIVVPHVDQMFSEENILANLGHKRLSPDGKNPNHSRWKGTFALYKHLKKEHTAILKSCNCSRIADMHIILKRLSAGAPHLDDASASSSVSANNLLQVFEVYPG